MAAEAGSSTSDDDSAVLATGLGTVVVDASHDGVATSLCTGAVVVVAASGDGVSASLDTCRDDTGRSDTSRSDTGTSSAASMVLANALNAADGGFLLLFGATGLNAGCESQQGHGWGCEVHFY